MMLQVWFQYKFGRQIPQPTVSRILAQREIEFHVHRLRYQLYGVTEMHIYGYTYVAHPYRNLSAQGTISDLMLKEKAHQFFMRLYQGMYYIIK